MYSGAAEGHAKVWVVELHSLLVAYHVNSSFPHVQSFLLSSSASFLDRPISRLVAALVPLYCGGLSSKCYAPKAFVIVLIM